MTNLLVWTDPLFCKFSKNNLFTLQEFKKITSLQKQFIMNQFFSIWFWVIKEINFFFKFKKKKKKKKKNDFILCLAFLNSIFLLFEFNF